MQHPHLPRSSRHGQPAAWHRAGQALLAAEGAALAVVFTVDGPPLWRVVRAVLAVAAAALAVWLMRRAGRGAVALVAGIVGTVTGAGVASAQAAKAGAPMTTVAALAVLLAGVILLAWGGGAALIRAIPGWWRLLAVPAALGIAVFVLGSADRGGQRHQPSGRRPGSR